MCDRVCVIEACTGSVFTPARMRCRRALSTIFDHCCDLRILRKACGTCMQEGSSNERRVVRSKAVVTTHLLDVHGSDFLSSCLR